VKESLVGNRADSELELKLKLRTGQNLSESFDP
jgi:hypothetical protein